MRLLGLILPLGAFASIIAANVVTWRMVDAVNLKLPEKDRFDPFGWHPVKTGRLWVEYRRFYPNGPLRKHLAYLAVSAVAFLGATLAFLGLAF